MWAAEGPTLHSLSARLITGVVATVLLIGGASFWVLQGFYRGQLIASLADSTTVHGKLVEQTLRYAMHSRSFDLLGEMVRNLGDQRDVEKVMILNKRGVVRFSSIPAEEGRTLALGDPTCRICHEAAPSMRGRTVIFRTEGGRRVFRNVNPILNSETCFGCHPNRDRVNGVLIVDYSMAGIDASLERGARKMWFSGVVIALAITAVIVVLMRRVVLRRLRALVQVVDAVEEGRLDAPVEVGKADEIGLLGQHLKRMAVSLDQSLSDLREREAFLDAVINSADDGIVVVDEDLHIVVANRAAERILGARPPSRAATACQCAASCSGEEGEECPAQRTLATGRVTQRIRVVPEADGTERHYEVSASPLTGTGGRQQVLEVWRDITSRREIEAQLASSERLASLGLLAAGISHEINNPLASITTCLDGLRRRLRGGQKPGLPSELSEYLELIRGEVERCRTLTERLKLLARKPRQARQLVDVNAVVHNTLTLVRYMADERSVRVEVTLAPSLAPILADESQVRQVILNVVMNALQAIEGAGQVRVWTRANEGGVEVEVADSGRGIETRDLHRVFEPFFSGRAGGHGTGLGLFISKIIVDQLGGAIRVTSAPGSGTSFRVFFPGSALPRAEVGA